MKDSLEFNDPLYEILRFGNIKGSTKGLRETVLMGINCIKLNKLILPILNCPEIARLKQLKQAGFVSLVFPSATHTRFAHSLGSFHLGQIALNTVNVFIESDGHKSLFDFLKKNGWIEEFLVALFLHDLGHYPFSHTLENNLGLKDALGDKFVSHEEAACQLILGNGEIFNAFKKRYKKYEKEMVYNVLKEENNYQREIICFLITGNDFFLNKGSNNGLTKIQKAAIKFLHNMVSGEYDFDRIDHYRRDSFFTGLGHTFKPYSLLSGLQFICEKDKFEFKENHSKEAEGQIATLLFIRNQLHERCFGELKNISFSAMLNHALTCHIDSIDIKRKKSEALKILTMTDSELLLHLQNSANILTKELIDSIMLSRPYKCIATIGKQVESSNSILKKIKDKDNTLVLGFSKYFDKPDKPWFYNTELPPDEKKGYIFSNDKTYTDILPILKKCNIDGIATLNKVENDAFKNF